ncbi:hypothetical protein [Nonomuraea sp. NPDC048826]|uniref:hypothetical protein n=1 Tax=Nonomuraea sp. NPDC048826 TaxID=3364347 RepID=UPI003715FC78
MSGDRACGVREARAAGRSAVRVLGAAVFATVCVYAALGTHLLAGGSGAPLGVVAAAAGVTGAGAWVLGRRRRGRGVLLVAAFSAQYGMHQVFGGGHGVGHHGGLSSGVGMVLAHVLVALVCAWWLERGETALTTVLCLLACSLAGLWRTGGRAAAWRPVAPVRLVPGVPEEPPVRAPQVLAWALSHRGPPG